MAKPKVRNSTKGGAEDEQENFEGKNQELNGRADETLVIAQNGAPTNGLTRERHEGNGRAAAGTTLAAPTLLKGQTSPEVAEKIKELVRLAQEQGYLTYNDINEALPDNMASPEEIEEIIIQL